MKEPSTSAEWQESVDMAYAARCLYDARLYGLITGGPKVNVARCDQILARGRQRKVFPSHDAIQKFVAAL